ncbi:MAG: acyltransferase [Rhodobiaceae bacterium]|nr:acyltransferase [Rhodobiaceae bacterium]MCC0057487.1 acyltransferase [Rhodobiaceae bacterium]
MKINALESLRGLAAVCVALFHANFFTNYYVITNPFIIFSFVMVDFFFVLSGFVIAHTYWSRIGDLRDATVFQARRFLRLYPLHILTLMVYVVIETMRLVAAWRYDLVYDNPAFGHNGIEGFFYNLVLLQGILPEKLSFNYPSWSISVEFFTYLVFAAIMVTLRSARSRTWLAVVIVVVSGVALHLTGGSDDNTRLALLRCIYAFFVGVLVNRLWERRPGNVWPLAAEIMIVVSVLSVIYTQRIPLQFHPLIFGLTILAVCWSGRSPARMLLESRVLVFLGTVSYGIYMWHAAVWWLLKNALQGMQFYIGVQVVEGGARAGKLDMPFAASTAFVVVGLTAIVALAWLSYRYVEMPINEYRHRIGHGALRAQSPIAQGESPR